MNSTVAIIGAGNLGQALAHLLKPHKVNLWDKVPGKVASQLPLKEIMEPAQVVFVAVPASAVREAIQEVQPFLKNHTIVVSLSKGIEPGSLLTVDQVLQSALPHQQPCAHLGGPMLASEIRQGKHAMAVVGSSQRSTYATLKKLFRGGALVLTYSRDIRGVAVAGVLKNIYTLPLGIAAGLELGNNAVGWLAYLAIKEMQVIMPMLGGARKTILSPAGIGDFITTGTSPHSMNYRAGLELAKTGSATTVSEGMLALPSVLALVGTKAKRLPLLTAIADILEKRHDPRTALLKLLK